MTIGIIKLSYKGNKDITLINNPNIDFWNFVYKKHTQFSVENITIDNEDNITIQENDERIFRFRLHRLADLIEKIWLKINIPSIYNYDNKLKFSWIKNLGCSIIKYARLYFDDNLIEEIDGDYLIMYNELYHNETESEYFNNITGNVDILHSPEDFFTSNISLKNDTYLQKDFNSPPSIPKY